MKRMIELKHVGPREHVQRLLEELGDRLEEKLRHFPPDVVSLHVLFEENRARKLYRTSIACHVPGHTVAAREERREAGAAIREAFAELERQLEKQKAVVRHEHLRRKSQRTRRRLGGAFPLTLCACLMALGPGRSFAEDATAGALSPKVAEAIHLIESDDAYQRQVGFLRLEALREPAAAGAIRGYVDDKDPELRAMSLRALAAIEGPAAIPLLLQRLQAEKHPRVRRAILLGLEPLEPHAPGIFHAFLRSLRDRKPEVRIVAVDLVSRIDHARSREAILTRHRRERHRDVRRVVDLAMRRLGYE